MRLTTPHCALLSEPFFILGEGSNTIFVDNYEGIILQVCLKGIEIKETSEHFLVRAAAGENWHQLIVSLMKKGIFGLENLALIPGTVGAAPIQNIGAYGCELADFCQSVETLNLLNGHHEVLTAQDCRFGYRDSVFKRNLTSDMLITHVNLMISKAWRPHNQYGELQSLGDKPSAWDIFSKVVEIRQSKLPDPKKVGNAGSFFKNPVLAPSAFEQLRGKWPNVPAFPQVDGTTKVPAAWLIDTLGFKGKSVGGIGCHSKQPLVLINQHQGTGQELLAMARMIRDKVFDEFNIVLENEVRLVGKHGLVTL